LRFDGINPFYVAVFLKSKYGHDQIWLRSKGVGAPKIPFDEIKAIKIAEIPVAVQDKIEKVYLKMHSFHEKAMASKSGKDEIGHRKYIQNAEDILNDLVSKTEAVIRGEREDVI